MKLPEHERQAHREAFRAMTPAQKAEYVFAYYKLPLVLAFVALVAAGSALRIHLAHKDALLYVGYANVAIEDTLDATLTEGFVEATGADPRTSEVYRYPDLYLADAAETLDHQYSYASRLKVLATVDAEQLDVVLMDRDAYDLLSQSGYLLDLEAALATEPQAAATLGPLLAENVVVLADNRIEVELGEADAYEAEVQQARNALDASGLPCFESFSGSIYLGIIGNTPRLGMALAYLEYLCAL